MIRDVIDFLESHELRPLDGEFIRDLWPAIMEVVRNPASNRPAALLLVLIAVALAIVVVMAVLQVVLRGFGDEEGEYEYVFVDEAGNEILSTQSAVGVQTSAPRAAPKDPLRYHRAALWAVCSLVVLLLAAGMGSQSREICLSCHAGTEHTAVAADDAHQSVRCTDCHESVNALASVSIAVPSRMAHILSGFLVEGGRGGYAPVAGSACRGCHEAVIREVVEIPDRALRVSHQEPIEAGARCMHCHVLNEKGKLGRQTAGMGACLRCHNDVAAAAGCSVCHTGDTSLAVMSSVEHRARQIISQPDCYSCHRTASCDACHGVRLPHVPDYRLTHMMDAARDIWFNRGDTCFACHTPVRNSCYQRACHAQELDFHRGEDPAFPRNHGTDPDWACDSCHVFASRLDDPCTMCHESTP